MLVLFAIMLGNLSLTKAIVDILAHPHIPARLAKYDRMDSQAPCQRFVFRSMNEAIRNITLPVNKFAPLRMTRVRPVGKP